MRAVRSVDVTQLTGFAAKPLRASPNGRRRQASSSVQEMQAVYKPNFCCECGERVVRARWRVWTSRRFCHLCGRRFRRESFTSAVVLACALFGPGFILGRILRPSPPPLVVERGTLELAPAPTPGARQRQSDAARIASPAKPETIYGPDGTANERPTEPDEVVYICGARTKKGTPCQRRVRGGPVRCWQHRGMPAMLPASKLIVPG
jgi:hypothetical protein